MFHEKYQEILELVLRINQKTEYAAFFDLQGHVDCLCVRVAKGKEVGYNDRIYSADFCPTFHDKEEIDSIIDKLKKFLEVR